MKSAKILFVNHTGKLGGAENGLLDIMKHLDRSRFTPLVAIPADGPLAQKLQGLDVETRIVPMIRFTRTMNPLTLLSYWRVLLAVRSNLADLIRNEEIALVHSNSNIAHIYAGAVAAKCNIPSIWHSRDLVELGILGERLCRSATIIIAISNAVAKHLERYGARNKIRTIHNGIDLAHFVPGNSTSNARKKLGLDANRKLVVMIGQLAPWKKHALFIEACAQLVKDHGNLHCLIVGSDLFDDHPRYRASLEALVHNRGLSDRLSFLGQRDDVVEILKAAYVLVHPASREPFGRVVAEAMAMKLPVVAANAAGPSEIIENEVSGLLAEPDSPVAIARAVERLLSDLELAERIGCIARERIEASFSLERCVEQISEEYDKLLRGMQ